MQRITAARRVRFEKRRRLQARQKRACPPRVERAQPERQRRATPQRPAGADHRLHHRDRRARQHHHQLRALRDVIPHSLHDARKALRGTDKVGNLVEHHRQRLLDGERREEPQRGLPAGEAAAREVGCPIAEIAPHGIRQPGELDALGLLGGAEEHSPPMLCEVRQQEGLADASPTPHHRKLRAPPSRLLPGSPETRELLLTVDQRCERHTGKVPQMVCTTRTLYVTCNVTDAQRH